MSDEVSDDCEGNIMDIALATIRHKGFPLLRVGNLRYLLDKKDNPVILVGYGHDDPEQMGRLCHIIKFRISGKGVACYGVLSAMKDYAVKHTRVAKVNVRIFASEIPTEDERQTKKFLRRHYMKHVEKAVMEFRKRGHKVNRFGHREGGRMSLPLWMDDNSSEGEEVSRSLVPKRNKHKKQPKGKKRKKKESAKSDDEDKDKNENEDEDEEADADVEGGADEEAEEEEEEVSNEDIDMVLGESLFIPEVHRIPQARGAHRTAK